MSHEGELQLLREMRDMAVRMRIAQRAYFRLRTPKALEEAKIYERAFDQLLEAYHAFVTNTDQNLTLFDGEE